MKKLLLFFMAVLAFSETAQADCAFKILYTSKAGVDESRIFHPRNMSTAAECEARARMHCGAYDRTAVQSQKITWDFADVSDVSKWAVITCEE